MKGAVVSIDSVGKVFLWNPAAERMFGYSADEAMGRQLSGLVAAAEGRTASGRRSFPRGRLRSR